ncbi:hypothetical protein PFICI_08138 [Pestalotiopsis fici W106-1]|uniref:Heterokaryon incompatibility domain-containing protein n=1 Tax=Pestalotiopsis fici (strain W106-1 / CGMCC3.15140) TaxID=1229662 RepID=W3X3M2_PESFW|nr:uncharacterized protein PFICI_08138 [Pestalotiopsis fici W106-1]ETS80609.1 hypothetical protein PFICI_08138 [Pestalotiopsis fici W106-1]
MGNLLLDRSTWSQSHYQAIQNWHRDCHLNHKECNKSISGHEKIHPDDVLLPTRCVEFEFFDEQNPWTSSIQWVLRETKGQRGKYIALSHRWVQDTGEASTTTDNYEDRNNTWNRAQGYHLLVRGKLSALFLDIGRLACHLGIRYVWIDSLCIIQNDKDDWDRESIKMADYYQRSWLTVAVTYPSDTGGIFQQNVSKIPRITRLPYQDKKGDQNGHFYVQAGIDKTWAEDYNKTIINSDLRKRAWVFQEWRLSRRILALSNQGMFLQCQSESPRSLDGYKVDTSKNTGIDSDYVRWLRNLDKDSYGYQILHSWEFIVEEYSGLELTKFEEDRLVALAGIAREYGRALTRYASKYGKQQHTYICGLWTGWFRGLLWEQADPYRQTRTKGFPTWSWLSIASVPETDTTGMTEGTLTGLHVRWPGRTEESAVCKFLSPILVPVTDNCRPRFERAGQHELNNLFDDLHSGLFSDVRNDLHGKIFGNDIRFAILPLEGRKLDICIDRYFESLEDADIAATMTGHRYPKRVPHEYMTMAERSRDSGRLSWRKVCLKSSCNTIIGWGSIEHPDYQADETVQSATPIYAFVVCKLSEAPGGYGLGHLSRSHTAFEVLYVRHVEIVGQKDCYERIGVGRLFGNGVIQEFESSLETRVNLV